MVLGLTGSVLDNYFEWFIYFANEWALIQNEEEVGAALKESNVPREDIWITSKVSRREIALRIPLKVAICSSGTLSTPQKMSNPHSMTRSRNSE
jgi:hypothetical protein